MEITQLFQLLTLIFVVCAATWVLVTESRFIVCIFRGHVFHGKPYDCTTVKIDSGQPVVITEKAKIDHYLQCKFCKTMNPEYYAKISQRMVLIVDLSTCQRL